MPDLHSFNELKTDMLQEFTPNFDKEKIIHHLDRFPETRVMVIGDIILDEYIWGDVSRISPEAPVPVVEVREETRMLGGAANVINNIHSLGGKPTLCGVLGNDRRGKIILEMLKERALPTDGIIKENDRTTSMKTRIVAHQQQVVRFDRETKHSIKPESIRRILKFIRQNHRKFDVIIVEDYGKGVISDKLMEGLREVVMGSEIVIAVDPKISHFSYYRGVDVITPNHHEAGAFCRLEINDQEMLLQAGRRIIDELDCRSVLITQGKDGMTLFEKSGEIFHIPTVARKVFDVTGAGDTVISTLAMGLASGLDYRSAAIISNFAAGIVVGEVGTSTVKIEELKKIINQA